MRRARDFREWILEEERKPAFVRAIRDLVEEWRGGKLEGILRVRGAAFDTLYYQREPVSWSMEMKDRLIAEVIIAAPHAMDRVYAEVYRRMKAMECMLSLRGLLRKRVVPEPHPNVRLLGESIGLSFDEGLARRLLGDPEIPRLLISLKAAEFSVSLKSSSGLEAMLGGGKEAYVASQVAYYRSPQDLVCYITLVTMLPAGPGIRGKALAAIRLLDRAAAIVRELAADLYRRLSGSGAPR